MLCFGEPEEEPKESEPKKSFYEEFFGTSPPKDAEEPRAARGQRRILEAQGL